MCKVLVAAFKQRSLDHSSQAATKNYIARCKHGLPNAKLVDFPQTAVRGAPTGNAALRSRGVP
jgi:hypothetical protein